MKKKEKLEQLKKMMSRPSNTPEKYDVDPLGSMPGEMYDGPIETVKKNLEKKDGCEYIMTEASPIRDRNVAPEGCITAHYHFAINNAPGGRAYFFWKKRSAVMTEHLRAAGSVKSEAKAAASRENGKKGGRPVYKWSITYSRGTKGTCGKNEESIVTASTAKAAIKTALDTFDHFGDQIPKSKFKWHGDFYCASSGNWEEGFEATKFEK